MSPQRVLRFPTQQPPVPQGAWLCVCIRRDLRTVCQEAASCIPRLGDLGQVPRLGPQSPSVKWAELMSTGVPS